MEGRRRGGLVGRASRPDCFIVVVSMVGIIDAGAHRRALPVCRALGAGPALRLPNAAGRGAQRSFARGVGVIFSCGGLARALASWFFGASLWTAIVAIAGRRIDPRRIGTIILRD